MRDRIGFLIPGDRPGVRSQSGALRYSISRLPARKKKIYIHTTASEKRREPSGGFVFQIWKGVWSMAKPLVVAYLTKKIAEKAKIPGAKWL